MVVVAAVVVVMVAVAAVVVVMVVAIMVVAVMVVRMAAMAVAVMVILLAVAGRAAGVGWALAATQGVTVCRTRTVKQTRLKYPLVLLPERRGGVRPPPSGENGRRPASLRGRPRGARVRTGRAGNVPHHRGAYARGKTRAAAHRRLARYRESTYLPVV